MQALSRDENPRYCRRQLQERLEFLLLVEGPEYTAIRGCGHNAKLPSDTPVACGVRVRFRLRDGGRTTNDDTVIWVTGDHNAVDWSGDPDGDNRRQYVRRFAKK